jgi:hypothetical protein
MIHGGSSVRDFKAALDALLLWSGHCPFERLPNEARIGDATRLCPSLHLHQQGLRHAHVDLDVFLLEFKPCRFELRKIKVRKVLGEKRLSLLVGFKSRDFFFIRCDLLSVHGPGSQRADEAAFVSRPYREGHEDGPPCACTSHCNQAVLVCRVLWVRGNAGTVRNQGLNLRNRNSMLLALRPVAVIQSNPLTRKFILPLNYTNV